MIYVPKPLSPLIRPLPYPYKGALALSSDLEFMSLEFLEGLMRFLNTKDETPLGRGLGLEVTSSVFFYSGPASFSCFDGLEANAPETPKLARLLEYLKAGWLDTNHSFGDFTKETPFTRNHALRAYELLAANGIRLEVYTNHGDYFNMQNVGADASYHKGDVQGSDAYHSDLLTPNGVRFVWTDSMTSLRTSPSPAKPERLDEASQPGPSAHGSLKALMRKVKALRHGSSLTASPPQQTPPSIPKAEMLPRTRLQDGTELNGFVRFRSTGGNAPNLSSLGYQLGQVAWEELYGINGAAFIYQHLGILYRSAGKCFPSDLDAVRARPEVYLAPFRLLAQERDAGRLWVAGLAKLLNYLAMIDSTKLENTHDANYTIVCPFAKSNPAALHGLTIYCEPAQNVKLSFEGKMLDVLHNGPDETGRYSVSLPLSQNQSIW